MSVAATALQRVIVNGESLPVLSHIVDFAGLDVRFSEVNTAFHRAMENRANQVCRMFTAVSADADLHPDEGSPARMQAKFLEIEQAHRDWAGGHFLWGARLYEWPAEWVRVRGLMEDILRQPDGPAKNLCSEKLLQQLNRLGAEHQAEAVGGVAGHMAAADQEPMQRPLETLKSIGFDESLQQRFLTAIAPRRDRGALNPKAQPLQSLKALHEAQRERVALSVGHRLRFEQLPNLHSFAYEDLLQAERIAHAADWMEWNTVLQIGQMITNELFPAIAPETTVAGWRAWLERPANARHVQNLHHFYLNGQCIFPRGIDRFSGLQSISFYGTPENYLTAIPAEVGNLPQLRDLQLIGHRIREIPVAIAGLRRLEKLCLGANRIEELPEFLTTLPQLRYLQVSTNPIRVLPDALYRHLEPAVSFLFSGQDWLLIDRPALREIPFRLWFRELCMINLFVNDDRCLWDCIFAIPVLLINFLMLEIVEPIITFFRDQLGYSRMVEVEPAPQVLAVE